MRALINYDMADKNYLPLLAHALRQQGIQGMSTSVTHTALELQEKAKTVSADIIILCHTKTLQAITYDDTATLDAYRGSRINSAKPVFVINSLAHLVTKEEGPWLLDRDLGKIKQVHVPAAPFNWTLLDEVHKFPAALDIIANSTLVALDIETDLLNAPDKKDKDNINAGDTIITCISWACLHGEHIITFVLPLVTFGEDFWRSNDEYAAAIEFMQQANKTSTPKVAQNGMYDSTHLIRYHAEPHNWCLDTYGMSWAEYASLSRDLSFLSSIHLYDHLHWKEELAVAKKNGDKHMYWTYNAKDSWRTLRIAIQQLRTMPTYAKRNYAEAFYLVHPFLYCSFEGILVNNKERMKLRTEAEAKLQAALVKLQTMFSDPNFNPGSWQQVEKYIYTVFGAKKPKIGKSTSCTDEKNLLAVGGQHPLLAKLTTEIISYREAQKAIGTYFSFKQINNRLLYALDPFGTDSARAACKASSMWSGTQVQNIPGYAKGMLEADAGYELCEVDNKQSEARCTAYLAKEYHLAEALEDAVYDFYKRLGTIFFSIPYEEVTDFFRNKVLKKIVHGTNYMMGATTFIENIGAEVLYETASKLGITLVNVIDLKDPTRMTIKQFAQQLLDVYHKPFPRIREWYKEIYNEILSTGYLVSPDGYTRRFFGDISKRHDMLRGAVAHLPQNWSVRVINKGVKRIYKELVIPNGGRFRLKAQVHDSTLSQYPAGERDIWVPRIKECMNNPTEIFGRTLNIPTDAKAGANWGKKALQDA